MMERDRAIVIDNYEITNKTIETAFKSAKAQNKTYQVLAETFTMMNLNKLYQSNPADSQVKQAIKTIADSSFIPQVSDEEPINISFDLSEVFPQNKIGNFGRVLIRKCRLTEKGIMEFSDDSQQPKLKEIKTIINKVQAHGAPNNNNKIDWLQQSKKYPFRIVLIDKNDGHRGIYFNTLQKAEKIRIVLSQRYLYNGNFAFLIASANKIFSNQTIQMFKNKLVTRHKMLNKSTRFSRKVNFAESVVQQSKFNRPNPNTSIFNYQNSKMPTRNINSQNSNMVRLPQLLQSTDRQKLDSLFQKITNGYVNNFFETWQNKAKQQFSSAKNKNSVSPIKQDPYSRFNQNVGTEPFQKSKINIQNDKTSRKQESIFSKDVPKERQQSNIGGYTTSIVKDKRSQFKQKDSFVKQFDKDLNQHFYQLHFYSIEFLTLSTLFFKPIVTIELIRDRKVQQAIIYNTIIKKKEPTLSYDLIKSSQEEFSKLNGNLKQYEISVKVIDFLGNQEVLSDKISMKMKVLLGKNALVSDNKSIILQFGPKKSNQNGNFLQQQNQSEPIKATLQVPPLPESVRDKINQYWQKQSQSQGYYSQTNLSIYKMLSQIEVLPLTWWKGISEDQYELLQIVQNASKILGFKMIRSFPHIIKAFVTIYPNLQEFTQKLLSFITSFLKIYYYPQHLNRVQKFHKLLGLDEDCQFISKVNFQILIIQKIVQLQCPSLSDKFIRTNLNYGYQLMQYIYEAFSRNFTPNHLIQLWNYLYQNLELLQLNMILITVVLIKHYEQDLIKAKRLKDFSRIFQSKNMIKFQHILTELNTLKGKYFGQVRGLIDQIKNIFNSKPLQPAIYQFYKRQTAKIDKRKIKKTLQKKSVLRKVNKQIDIEFPQYANQHYTLHIYFTKIPQTGGSLTIKCNDIDYQCLNLQKNRYFIIGQVYNTLTLTYLDLKSNQYNSQLILNQGIHEHTIYLTSTRNSTTHKISYIGGLVTDSQIDIFKRGKIFDHFISPFIKQSQFRQEMSRPIQQTYFLRKYDSNSSKDDLIKKIKTLFCSGSKTFNEIQFYIQQVQTSELTIQQKFYLIKLLAKQFSQQFCLCSNEIFQKHFIRHFLQSSGYEISSQQYQFFFNDSLQYEFDAPKIIKCRYYPLHQPNKQIKLEKLALNYFVNKCHNYLYPDIIVQDFIHAIKPSLNQQLGARIEGQLKLYYSSNGEVNLKCWHLKLKNKTKEIYYEQIKDDMVQKIQNKEIGQPQILMTEVLPSFAKISTILDFVNTNRHVDLKHKYQDKDRKKIAQNINILKDCQVKFSKVISMRYLEYPKKLHFPFFNYYYELTHQCSAPAMKNIVFNSLKSDLKALCLFEGQLKFGQNAKVQSFAYKDDIGLYGNLRLMSKDAKGWFFFGLIKDQHQAKEQVARVFVNYGYGIFRWQPCQVIGYLKKIKQKKTSRSGISSEPKQKIEYLIIRRNQQKNVKQYQLQMSPKSLQKVEEIIDSPSRMYRQQRLSVSGDSEDNKNINLKYLSKFIK